MDARDFISSAYGQVVTDPLLAWEHPFFNPAPLPLRLELKQETNDAVQEAALALGQLGGLSMLVPNPHTLLGPSMAQEAVASSRIEGTQASLNDVLSAEADQESITDPDIREVNNYLHALNKVVELLSHLPLTQRFFNALHAELMDGVRGEEKYPGEFRRSPVWIGAADATPRTAKFIPPHQDYLPDAISDLEQFANTATVYTPVVKAALLHYQFETIHPYLDGDGRIGRLLIIFSLMQDGALPHPTLGISGYFESRRQEYYDRLQAVRERDEMNEWIQFFAAGITDRARQGAKRIRSLVSIREKYRGYTQQSGDRSAFTQLPDVLFKNPVVTVSSLRRLLDISQPTAATALRKAEEIGWVTPLDRSGRGGRRRWLAEEIWEAVQLDDK